MEHVFLVHHTERHRKSALKVLSLRVVRQHEDYIRRFRQERCNAESLNHPNVVTLYAIGEQDGYHFLEMAECLSYLLVKTSASRPRDTIEAMQLLQAALDAIRDMEFLLVKAFGDDQSVSWSQYHGRYELQVQLPDARQQRLYIGTNDHRSHEQLLMIFSIYCPAEPAYYEQALMLNAEISHGGFALKEVDGETKFVMMDTYPHATVDVEEIRKSVLEVAYRADEFEKRLTGRDLH